MGNLRPAGILRDGDDLSSVIAIEIIRPIRTDWRHREMDFRAELPGGILQAKAKRIRAVPVDQQKVLTLITIDVQDLNGFDAPGVRDFLRLGQRTIGVLREQIESVVAQQK